MISGSTRQTISSVTLADPNIAQVATDAVTSTAQQVLFTITKKNLDTGLRGIPVGTCRTSFVDPIKGLSYVGRPITELVSWDPINVIYLLYHGTEGSAEEMQKFRSDLESRGQCSPDTLHQIRQLPRGIPPMKMFEMALLLSGSLESTGDYQSDCLNLIAKVPQLAAHVMNHHAGWEVSGESIPNRGYIENFIHMLRVPCVPEEDLYKAMRLFSILHFDHSGGNLSTFVGKAVASGLEDMYGSIAAAMTALEGPRHGRANRDSLEFIEEIRHALGEDVNEEQIEAFVRGKLSKGKVIPGFGHAVLRVEDPRATVLYEELAQSHPYHPLVKIAFLLRTVASRVLAENPKITDPHPNVDAISGVYLAVNGFAYPEYFTVLFGLSRTVGIAIQIVHERCLARNGKGLPLMRPKFLFSADAMA